MIELIIAAGIMAVVASGVATAIFNVVRQQNNLTNRMDGTEFVASFGRQLMDKTLCRNYFSGRVVPANWTAFTVPNYSGFGDRDGETLQAGYILIGSPQNPGLQVREMVWRRKPDATPEPVRITEGGVQVNYAKTPVQARISLTLNDQGQARELPPRYVEFVVLNRQSDNVVTACDGSPTMVDACSAVGTTFDPTTGTCIPAGRSCQMMGSYALSRCNRTDFPCRATQQVPPRRNEYTNDYRCPAGSEPSASYVHSWVSEERSGKKSSVNVTNYVEVYMCLICR